MALPIFAPKFTGTQAAYSYDFAKELAFGDIVLTATATVPAGITLIGVSTAGNVCSAILSGGTPGEEYIISYFATTAAGMRLQGDAILPIIISI